ncbi:MAG: Tryptophan-tRNA ligase [candidate division WS6 bacterium GW2011_GWF2_39_15]|uniref:Tryptophan--tRNA ligase n=1 Tax=candidate division WS6 bacterium GW2011_GWF2_39_15 TaxID=1619100 RepID=A0A0G0QXN0_9BACT|nr:MAG: Tryptophan-tRNA ligase [candidate division WS6 bacterium GW2011_GWF2_39_15]
MDTYKRIVEKLNSTGIKYEEVDQTAAKNRSVDELVRVTVMTYGDGMSTLFFKNERDEYIVILRRDDRNVRTQEVKKLSGSRSLNFAEENDLEKLGFETGLVSPALLGELQEKFPVKIYIDSMVMDNEKVICGIGREGYGLKIKVEDLLKVLGKYKVAEITEPNLKRQAGVVSKKRILTGDTPSGKLHIGHYVGTLENRVKLQDEYETYILLANNHAYANYFDKSELINQNVYDVFLDNLAVGIDPNKSTIYLESGIPETHVLYSFFLNMVKHSRALRNPSVKDEVRYKKLDPSLGFISYPILQAADILQFNASLVPVGEDQLPVIEQAREIAKDFNKAYGNLFVMPEGRVGRVARLVGTDGKEKMSKSGHNAILLSDDEETLKKKVMSMYTDPNRIKASDKGTVEGNPVFIYHDAFNTNKDEINDLKERYTQGKVGDIEVKEKLFAALNTFLEPIREKRKYYEERPDEAKDILISGTEKARKVVVQTLEKLQSMVGINKLIEKE